MLVLSSIALTALLVSGVALSFILPGYFKTQVEEQLKAAATSTVVDIQNRLNQELDQQNTEAVYAREVRDNVVMGPAAQYAATQIAKADVSIRYADGSLAGSATPDDPTKLANLGLAPDADVRSQSVTLPIQLGPDEAGTPSRQIMITVTLRDPYTSRAATEEQVRGTLVAAGLIALLGSVLLGLFAARQLTGPLSRLRRVSARLSRGELGERVPPSGVMEIDQLGSQFNHMADQLSESLRLLEADRDRLREFVADVSHELRTPIAALRTFTELQRDGGIDEATRQEFLERSNEQLRRLEWLSSNLLDLSRIEAGIFPLDVREGDLREPIRAVVEAHAEVAEERGVSLGSAVPSEPVVMRFDRERVVQLVNNLVGNALKFTKPGGQVEIEVTDAPDEARIVVRDTGPGIPETELPHIFERFYRGTNVGEARASGSGLGLAIVRSIVDMHGGDVSVASSIGQGTAFTITLPRIPEPVAMPPEPRDGASGHGRQGVARGATSSRDEEDPTPQGE